MISAVDEAILRQLVGPSSFARGKTYANRGAVLEYEAVADGSRIVGEVQGGSPEPYRVSVELTRARSSELVAVRTECTCPVETNCKHAVALLLVDGAPSPTRRPFTVLSGGAAPPDDDESRSRSASVAASWEDSLRSLLVGGEKPAGARDEEVHLEIGLQFELVVDSASPGRGASQRRAGIRLRPVVARRSGSWTRTGVSWSNLDHLAYTRSGGGEVAERLRLVKEVRALSHASSSRPYYGYVDDVWLETINSRRIWDLLLEAQDLGVPLLRSARRVLPVILASAPAEATIRVARVAGDLWLEPQVEVDGTQLPRRASLLLGRPAHAIAWWDEAEPGAAASDTPPLRMACFEASVDDSLRRLLEGNPICVPALAEERFFAEIYPQLREQVPVRSNDESVRLPERAPTTLVLNVAKGEGQRLFLTWARGRVGTNWVGALWPPPRRIRDRRAEELIATAASLLESTPALFERTPFGERLAPVAKLDGMEAVRFVSDTLALLDAIPGVEIEMGDAVPDYREAVEVPIVRLNGTESRDGDWFDLAVEVSVGGEEVPFHELFVALATGRSHLVLPSGTYFSLERDELRQLAQLIAEARALDDSRGDSIRLSRFQASLWEDLCRLGVVATQAGAWEASVRALTEATDRVEHPQPATLRAALRPYQQTGFNWLAFLYDHRLGGVLADEMGLGKTLQALALVCHTKENGATDLPYLVVAPTSVVENWAAECRRFAPELRAVVVGETERRRGVALAELARSADIVITSYALFRIEYGDYESLDWAGLFVDEAQFAKNRRSKTYQQLRLLPVPFKVAITGTPMENNLMELWSLLSITAPGLFASPDRFEEQYRVPIEKQADAERLAQLRRRLRPLMVRRTKEQVAAELPDKQEQVLELDLNAKHKRLYQKYLARERQKVLGLIGDMSRNRFEIFRSLTLLRQASLDVSLVDEQHATVPSTKLDALMEMLEGIVTEGHRVLVFSQFTRFLSAARQRIAAAGIDHCYLDGKTRKRETVLSAFRSGEVPVFLISLRAGGFGLNLTEADYCILLDPWWNPATEAQAVDRIHRIGQTRKVIVYRLVARDTIEEKVMALKANKSALFANVIDAGGLESGALTAADIRTLVS